MLAAAQQDAGYRGHIVNTASTSGLRWTGAAQVGYASTKAAVISFSRVTAVQYAEKGIRVNTVVPGTPLLKIVDPASLWVATRVDESMVARVAPTNMRRTADSSSASKDTSA